MTNQRNVPTETRETLTESMTRTLRDEAASAGDSGMVATCDAALAGDLDAARAVASAITSARAMDGGALISVVADETVEITDADGDTVSVEVGDWVEVFGDDYDRGRVLATDGGLVTVAWTGSATRTTQPAAALGACLVYGERPTDSEWRGTWGDDDA